MSDIQIHHPSIPIHLLFTIFRFLSKDHKTSVFRLLSKDHKKYYDGQITKISNNCFRFIDHLPKFISDCTALRHLEVCFTGRIDLSGLENCTELEYLDVLSMNDISFSEFPVMRKLTHLKLTTQGAVRVGGALCKNISYLDLSNCSKIIFLPDASLTSLKSLDLSKSGEIVNLAEVGKLSSLTHLDLSFCCKSRRWLSIDVGCLSNCTALRHLNLLGTNTVNADALENLAELDFISKLRLKMLLAYQPYTG